MADRLVTLGVYTTAAEAQIDKNFLETNGIDAQLSEDLAGPLFGISAGGVKLLVDEDQVQRAKLILDSIYDDQLPDVADQPASDEIAITRTCPKCRQPFGSEFRECPQCVSSEEFFEDAPGT
jgi:hypothetical protein